MNKNKTQTLKYLLITSVLLIAAGCFDDRENLFEHQVLEWEPTNPATNALNMTVPLEANQTETERITLRIQYAGEHQTQDITAAFEIDEENSSAEEGIHFEFLTGTSVIIPAGSSYSAEIEIEILSANIENGQMFDLILVISEESEIPPMENYKEFEIFIEKGV